MAFDYEQLIENLNDDAIIALMTNLGADRYENKPTHIIFPTICHNSDSSEASMKLYYYKDKKLFVCYTECGNMSIFTFLKHYYETRQIEYDWYNDIYQAVVNCSSFKPNDGFIMPNYKSIRGKYDKQNKITELKEYPNGVLDCFVKVYPPEWLNDNISRKAMDKYNIRYSISQNKIVIPHLDVNGRLVGIRGRALNPDEIENVGKYMPIKIENTWYTHSLSLNLYGLYENKENIKKSGICYIVEAEKSVLQAESFSKPNCCVAICGSNFNKYALSILIRECNPKEIILCLDKEEVKGEHKYFDKLYNICNKYKNYCNFSFVYDREGLIGQKDSPTDHGEEIFNKLIERRVIVK